MNIKEQLDMQGHIFLQLHDQKDDLAREVRAKNSIVQSGRDLVAKLFINETITPVSHLAIGTGNTAVAPGDTALGTELFRKAINPVDPTIDLTVTTDNKIRVRLTAELDFNEGNGNLTEAGLFNDATAGVMYNRVVFPSVQKTTDFRLTFVWEILF
ncbi:MAG: hypothetical protein AAGI38_12920 [Bacteroidota bacterium]